jgi:hypothetical protein
LTSILRLVCCSAPVTPRHKLKTTLAKKERVLRDCLDRSDVLKRLESDHEVLTLRAVNFARACQLHTVIEALRERLDRISPRLINERARR